MLRIRNLAKALMLIITTLTLVSCSSGSANHPNTDTPISGIVQIDVNGQNLISNGTNVSTNPVFTIAFNQVIDPSDSNSKITLVQENSTPNPQKINIELDKFHWSSNNSALTFSIAKLPLTSHSSFKLTLNPLFKDSKGRLIFTAPIIVFFTTGSNASPTVSMVDPGNNATNVSLTPEIELHFSLPVANVTNSTLNLKDNNGNNVELLSPISLTDNQTFTTRAKVRLNSKTRYTLSVESGIYALNDQNNQVIPTAFNFTTIESNVPPVGDITVTVNEQSLFNATNVSTNPLFKVSFNQLMNPTSADNSSITLLEKNGSSSTNIPLENFTWSENDSTLTFNVATPPLNSKANFVLVLGTALKNQNNQPILSSSLNVNFITGSNSRPTVSMTKPSPNYDVDLNPQINLRFSLPVTNVNTSNVILSESDGTKLKITPPFSTDNSFNFSFRSSTQLKPFTRYVLSVESGINAKNDPNNHIDFSKFSFTTKSEFPPFAAIVATVDGNKDLFNAESVSLDPTFKINFNREINPNTVDNRSIFLMENNGTLLEIPLKDFTWSNGNTTVTFKVTNVPLLSHTPFILNLNNSILDPQGNSVLPSNFKIFFTTGSATPPTVDMLQPSPNYNVDRFPQFVLKFSTPVTNVNKNSIQLLDNSGASIPISPIDSYNNDQSFSFTSISILNPLANYTLRIESSVTTIADPNNHLNPTNFYFTTSDSFTSGITGFVDGNDLFSNPIGITKTPLFVLSFAESIDTSSANSAITLTDESGTVVALSPFSWYSNNQVVNFTTQSTLNPGANYTLHLGTGLKNSSGQTFLLSPISGSFTTQMQEYLVVSMVSPNPTTNVRKRPQISLAFNNPVNGVSANSNVKLSDESGNPVAISLQSSNNNEQFTFVPNSNLSPLSTYTLTVESSITGMNDPSVHLNRKLFYFITANNDNLIWARLIGNNGTTLGSHVLTTNNGKSYLAGLTNTSLDGQQLTNQNYFIATVNSSGSLESVKLFGKINESIGLVDMGSDNFGNLYIVGYTSNDNGFIHKYDQNLNPIWIKDIANIPLSAITFDNANNIYVGGTIAPYKTDYYTSKIYESSGAADWIRSSSIFGPQNKITKMHIATDGMNLYIGTQQTIIKYSTNGLFYFFFDIGKHGTYNLIDIKASDNVFYTLINSTTDPFPIELNKYSNFAQLKWKSSINNGGTSTQASLSIDSQGSIYVCNNDQFGTYIERVESSSGNIIWKKQAVVALPALTTTCSNIFVDPLTNDIFLSGSTNQSIFNQPYFGGAFNAFVAKFGMLNQ